MAAIAKMIRLEWIASTVDLKGWVIGAVVEGIVEVSNVFEPVDFLLWQEKGSGNRVHRSVTPTLIEEATSLVKVVKEL